MSITTRRVIYSTFFLLFFISAPVILLYAAGYRLNTEKKSLESTGILILAFSPNDATVLVNGEPPVSTRIVNETMHIPNLTPGSYRIDVTKEGYTAWTKRLTILPNQTTFARHITLWKKTEPEERTATAFLEQKNEFVWAVVTEKTTGRMRLDYRPKERLLSAFSSSRESIALPGSAGYTLTPSVSPLVTLLDTAYGLLYLFDPDAKGAARFKEVFTNVRGAAWAADEQKLMWYNDHDVWLYDRETKTRTLVVTSRQTLEHVAWYPNSAYLFLVTEKKIKAIELDDRDVRNETDILSGTGFRDVMIDALGKQLLVLTKQKKGEKVLALELQ